VPIVRIKETAALAAAVASYFFSAFSLRTMIGDQIKTFPTLFDCWILTVCMGMVVSLLWIITRRSNTTRD